MSPRPIGWLLIVSACTIVGACATSGEPVTIDPPAVDQPTTSSERPQEPVPEASDPIRSTTETTEMRPDDDPARCERLTDFDSAAANQRWTVVNDNVMGGRSLGGLSFDAGTLIFEGDINTDGGGFSSVRLPLEPEALVPHDRIVFRVRPDQRAYVVTFDDDLASRDRRVSHRAPIEFEASGQWQTATVSFDELFPAIFGRPIDDLPFRKDLASRMGVMISDGIDGPFRLEIDWIDLCRR